MNRSLLNLRNKVAIITGAASGIGRATAILFARQNAKVIGVDIDFKGLESLKQELGSSIDIYQVDITNEQQVKQYINDVYNKYKNINILCNIAGVAAGANQMEELSKPLHLRDMQLFKKTIDVNLYGSIYNCRHIIQAMLYTLEANDDIQSTSIINTSSAQGRSTTAGMSDYNISKYAIHGLTHSLAAEYSASGIRCNCVVPGLTMTELMEKLTQKIENMEGMEAKDKFLQNIVKSIPQERGAKPQEIANLFLYLASDEASFCSGGLMNVDGGRSVQYSHFPSFISK